MHSCRCAGLRAHVGTLHFQVPVPACAAFPTCICLNLAFCMRSARLWQRGALSSFAFAACLSLQVFDAGSRTLLRQFKGHKAAVHVARFAADSLNVVTGGDDGLVLMWDVTSGQQVRGHWLDGKMWVDAAQLCWPTLRTFKDICLLTHTGVHFSRAYRLCAISSKQPCKRRFVGYWRVSGRAVLEEQPSSQKCSAFLFLECFIDVSPSCV